MSTSQVQNDRVPVQSSASSNAYLKWYFAFFVISGFCGLVYEVVWVRLAMASFGVTTALISIVISTFMAGLGLGSWGAGILSRKTKALGALRLYCLVELIIGTSAFLVPAELKLGRELMLHIGSLGTWQSSRYYLVAAALVVMVLIPWCTCLGSTFPLLMSVIRQSCPSSSERSFSFLYAANVLGALLGALLSAFVLIEMLGFQRTLWFGACLNALVAILAFGISSRLIPIPSIEAVPAARQLVLLNLYGLPSATILLLLFTSGMVSMGAEVVWIRQFTPFLGNWVYSLATILGMYLVMTYLGARDYRKWICKHGQNESAGVWSLLAVATLIPLIGASPQLFTGFFYLRILSIALFCILTGFLTPLLVDSWSAGEPDRAGTAYAFNILGCILGPILASFWLEPWLGERWSTLALSLPLFAVGAFIAFRSSLETESATNRLRIGVLLAAVTGMLLFVFSRDYETQYPERTVHRDYAATVLAFSAKDDKALLVNGVGMTALNPITKFIAHFPLATLNHPPQNGLVICFGMGTTFRSMVSWGIQTTAVDLIPSVPRMFSYFHADASKVVSSPNARIVIDDGRRFLDASNEKYDVIVVDPPPPVAAPGSSLLYSKEFYEVVKRHLKPGGVFQNWYPSVIGDPGTGAAIAKTLIQSFPYVRAYRSLDGRVGFHYLASMEPLPEIPASVLAARMPSSAISDFVEWGPEQRADKEFELVLRREVSMEDLVNEDPSVPIISDDQPINEYFLLRRLLHTSR
jgi:predicted membrane-bound spermidine synthase